MPLPRNAALLTTVFCLAACSSTTSSKPAGDGGTGNDSGSGGQCYDVPVSTVDGTSACGPMTCTPGQYCFDSAGICNQGCIAVANCASGEFCDMSVPMQDS